MAHTSPRNETQQHPSTHNDTQPNTMTLKEIIEGCFSRLGRVAATGIIIASSSASATPLVPVDWYQSNNPSPVIARRALARRGNLAQHTGRRNAEIASLRSQ